MEQKENVHQDIELGVVTLNFSPDGNPSGASFLPTSRMEFNYQFLKEFSEISCDKDPGSIKKAAELVFSAWFDKIVKIELADRDRYFIDTEITNCTKYDDGKVMTCSVKFIFRERREVLN